jgi:hypothetical protein
MPRLSVPDHQSFAPPPSLRADLERAWKIVRRLNALAPGDFDAMRALLGS